jgi:hypothetical protein
MGNKINRKHIVLAVPLVLGVAVFLASGLPGLVATMIYRSVIPSAVSWDGHDAYVKCDGAIKDATQWPKAPAVAC